MGKDLMLGGLEHLKRWKRRPRMIFPRALESKTHVLRRAPWTGPGSGPAPGVVTTECSVCGKRRALAGAKAGRGPPNGLGPQIALGSVHVIDAGETALVEGLRAAPWECGKGLAGMLQRFCSQLVKRRHPGIKVARLTRDDQLASRELKKYHLITKQVRRTRELGWAGLSPRGLRALSPHMQPVTGFSFAADSAEWGRP